MLSQSSEVSRSSHCISLYTHSDPHQLIGAPQSYSYGISGWGVGERVNDKLLSQISQSGVSRGSHGRSYVVRSGRLTAEKFAHLYVLETSRENENIIVHLLTVCLLDLTASEAYIWFYVNSTRPFSRPVISTRSTRHRPKAPRRSCAS